MKTQQRGEGDTLFRIQCKCSARQTERPTEREREKEKQRTGNVEHMIDCVRQREENDSSDSRGVIFFLCTPQTRHKQSQKHIHRHRPQEEQKKLKPCTKKKR